MLQQNTLKFFIIRALSGCNLDVVFLWQDDSYDMGEAIIKWVWMTGSIMNEKQCFPVVYLDLPYAL